MGYVFQVYFLFFFFLVFYYIWYKWVAFYEMQGKLWDTMQSTARQASKASDGKWD